MSLEDKNTRGAQYRSRNLPNRKWRFNCVTSRALISTQLSWTTIYEISLSRLWPTKFVTDIPSSSRNDSSDNILIIIVLSVVVEFSYFSFQSILLLFSPWPDRRASSCMLMKIKQVLQISTTTLWIVPARTDHIVHSWTVFKCLQIRCLLFANKCDLSQPRPHDTSLSMNNHYYCATSLIMKTRDFDPVDLGPGSLMDISVTIVVVDHVVVIWLFCIVPQSNCLQELPPTTALYLIPVQYVNT
eukprot:scaffold4117_cov97-Cylindrotheca_fusiformis.AAC.2